MAEAGLPELKEKLADEERVYAELLARLDAACEQPAPYVLAPGLPELVRNLNDAWRLPFPEPHPTSGLKGLLQRTVRRLLAPELDPWREGFSRQEAFNSTLVQFLNGYLEAEHRRASRLAELGAAVVRFAQRIDRLADAKDRLYASLGNARCDLLLEAVDRQLEALALGVKRMEDRLSGITTQVELARAEMAQFKGRLGPDSVALAPQPRPPAHPGDALASFEYLAFENRFRGSQDEIRERLAHYVAQYEGLAPVVELGSGRGEFLELLRERGVAARGVDGNSEMVRLCRERGLQVEEGELMAYLRSLPDASVGGIFAAQVIEHLPPPSLREMFESCYRSLRRGGKLIVETVNPRSLMALVESFYRDLTHQKPLHPDTIDFLLRAVGFREVRIEYRSPVPERAKLVPLPAHETTTVTLNENLKKLNALVFGDQDYAAIASK
jgi:SAM-dependent methyltransferase